MTISGAEEWMGEIAHLIKLKGQPTSRYGCKQFVQGVSVYRNLTPNDPMAQPYVASVWGQIVRNKNPVDSAGNNNNNK